MNPRAFLRRATVVLTATVAAAAFVGAPALASVDAPVDAGDVVVIDGNDRQQDVGRGGSAALFSLRLPDASTCPGDSLHDQWRVQSFMVPADVDVTALQYGVIGPEGEQHYALYDERTKPFVNELTRANEVAGQPGFIGDIPVFSFALFPVGTVAPGTYRVGLACTLQRETAKYWDAEIVIEADPSDQPAQLTWSVVGGPDVESSGPAAASDDAFPISTVLIIVAVIALAIGVLAHFRQRRLAATPAPAKEPS
jgi:hypothetical protein